MNKYYILAEDSQGKWAIFSEDFSYWYLSINRSGCRSILEHSLVYPEASNDIPLTTEGVNRARENLINNGLTYKDAVASLKAANNYQIYDLKRIKKRYRNSHTVTFTIISRAKALSIIKAIPVKSHFHYKKPKQAKRTSIEYRKFLKHLDKTKIYK